MSPKQRWCYNSEMISESVSRVENKKEKKRLSLPKSSKIFQPNNYPSSLGNNELYSPQFSSVTVRGRFTAFIFQFCATNVRTTNDNLQSSDTPHHNIFNSI